MQITRKMKRGNRSGVLYSLRLTKRVNSAQKQQGFH